MPFEVVLAAIASIIASVVAAGAKGIWVWGRELTKAEKREREWRSLALRGVGLTDAALDVAAKKIDGS